MLIILCSFRCMLSIPRTAALVLTASCCSFRSWCLLAGSYFRLDEVYELRVMFFECKLGGSFITWIINIRIYLY